MSEPRAPHKIDVTRPSPARIYAYTLGDTANSFAVDRRKAEEILRDHPEARITAIENRQFLVRAVTALARQGVRQFLDLGAGLPTKDNTHEVAQRVAPGSKTVYVDNDPMTLAHSQALLGDQRDTGYVHADIQDLDGVLSDPTTRRLIDFDEPVAMLFVSVLHFIRDDPAGLLERYISHLPAGGCLVLSHASTTGIPADLLEQIQTSYRDAPSPLYLRPVEEIEEMFGGLELLEPGAVVPVNDWPTQGLGQALTLPMLGGVARKR